MPKSSDETLRAQPVETLCDSVAKLAPFLENSIRSLASWDEVKTLIVRVDRLESCCQPGLLLIGDAAHAMSPSGGIGINLAIQDAVAAANALASNLRNGNPIDEALLRKVQQCRLPPTRIIQALQVQAQKRLISKAIGTVRRCTGGSSDSALAVTVPHHTKYPCPLDRLWHSL